MANNARLKYPQMTLEFFTECAMGHMPGIKTINKFGRNIEVDSGVTADVWDGGYTLASGGESLIWVAPTTARVHAIVSTSDNDSDVGGVVAQGDGARTIKIFGLTDWNTAEVSEDIVMDGTTAVNTSNSYVIIHRMRVLTKGGNANVNVGLITATAAAPDSTVTAQIRIGQGQTQMAIYGIPSTQIMYMNCLYVSALKAAGASSLVDISLLVNPEPDAEETAFLTKHTLGLSTAGTSAKDAVFVPPKTISGPAIIKVQALSGSNDMDVSAGFNAIVVDN